MELTEICTKGEVKEDKEVNEVKDVCSGYTTESSQILYYLTFSIVH